jgi:hypothetical protein
VRLELVKVATPPVPRVPVPRAVVEVQAAVGQLLKVTVPVGREGSLNALLAITVALRVVGWPVVGDVGEAASAVEVSSVNWALPVYAKFTVTPSHASWFVWVSSREIGRPDVAAVPPPGTLKAPEKVGSEKSEAGHPGGGDVTEVDRLSTVMGTVRSL